MKLMLDTSRFNKVEVAKPFEARMDNEGNHRRDKKQGGSGLPLWACKVAVYADDDVDLLIVTVAAENPPKLTQQQQVVLSGLEAMPWSTNKGESKVAYRAESVTPVSANKSTPQVKAVTA